MSSRTPAERSPQTLVDDGVFTSPDYIPSDRDDGPPRLLGRYTVVDVLGTGGMGTVFSAYDPELDRKVALKLLHAGEAGSSRQTNARARLLREAQAIAKVTHPNVIHVYDVGVVEHGGAPQVFVAMELVVGQSLRAWMEAMQQTERWRRGEAVPEILEVLTQAGRGLAAAHAAGLVHRDFKPDNALLGDDGLLRVVDFGLARKFEDSGDELQFVTEDSQPSTNALLERITVTGAVLGTPAYMAPEQFRGEPTDGRTDQFALCLTLYEALYGERPFPDRGYGLALAVMQGDMRPRPRTPAVPDYLYAAIERGLQTDPARRFPSMNALVEVLARDPSARRRRWAGWLAVGATVIGTAGLLTHNAAAPPPDPCAAGRARVEAVWGDDQREAVRRALGFESLPYTHQVTASTVEVLDDYAARWAQGHRDACEATHVRHEQTGGLLDKRMVCLERRLAALEAAAEALRDEDVSRIKHALSLAGGLPSLSACADVAALEAAVAPPADEATRQEVAAIRAELERAAAKQRLRQYDQALTLVEGLAERVERAGYAPLEAELMFHRGEALSLAHKLAPAEQTLRRALLRAQAQGQDALTQQIASKLSWTVGVGLARPEQGLWWADLAEATAERIAAGPELRSELLRSRAFVLVEWGLKREAIEVGEQALTVARQAYEPDAYEMLGIHSSLGSVYGRLGDMKAAQEHFERALAIGQRYLGDTHPLLLNHYRNLGNAFSAQHELELARANLEKAAEVTAQIPNTPPGERALVANALGNLALNERRWEVAASHFEQALSLREELLGPDHPQIARTLNSLANARLHLDDIEGAQALYLRSLKIREAAHGPEHPNLRIALDNLGSLLVRDDRPDEALPYLARADAIFAEHPGSPPREAEHRYWYGRALAQTREDVPRGEALVNDALARYTALGHDGMREEIRRWKAGREGEARGR